MILNNISKTELKQDFKPISKIESVNPLFSARYFAEYLGFEVVAQNELENEFMLSFNKQFLFLVGSNGKQSVKTQTIIFKTKSIESYYYLLLPKVKMNKHLFNNVFEILDCEGNTIVFTNE